MTHRTVPGLDAEALSGRTNAHLGPSDSSDSASDLAGLDGLDDGDPNAPVDVALRADGRRSLTTADALSEDASDAAGTGESRSAGADAGVEAADVGVDRVFTPGGLNGADVDEDEDPDLAFLDDAERADSADLEDSEDPDGPDDPGRSGARAGSRARLSGRGSARAKG